MRGFPYTLALLIALLGLTTVSAAPQVVDLDVVPATPAEGDDITVSFRLIADEPLGFVTIDVLIPGSTIQRTTQVIAESEYMFHETYALPYGYRGEIDITVRVQVEDDAPIFASEFITVREQDTAHIMPYAEESYAVQRARLLAAGSGPVAVVIDPEVPNVVQGEWIYWPITLINDDERPITVVLGVEGVRDWAVYRIDPVPVITVAPGRAFQAFLYMDIDDDATPGMRTFMITAEYEGQAYAREVSLAVLRPVSTAQQIPWGVWVLIVVLIIITFIILLVFILGRVEDEDARK